MEVVGSNPTAPTTPIFGRVVRVRQESPAQGRPPGLQSFLECSSRRSLNALGYLSPSFHIEDRAKVGASDSRPALETAGRSNAAVAHGGNHGSGRSEVVQDRKDMFRSRAVAGYPNSGAKHGEHNNSRAPRSRTRSSEPTSAFLDWTATVRQAVVCEWGPRRACLWRAGAEEQRSTRET